MGFEEGAVAESPQHGEARQAGSGGCGHIDIGIALLSHNMIWSLVLIIFAAFYLYNLHPDVVRANKRISLIGLVVIISMLVNFGAILSYNMGVSASRDLSSALVVNAIPIALGSVLLAVIFGYRVALCVGFFISSMTAMMVVPERAFDLAIKGMMICSLSALAVRSATNYRSYFIRTSTCCSGRTPTFSTSSAVPLRWQSATPF